MRSIERLAAGPTRYRVRVARSGPARAMTHLAQIESFRRAVLGSGLPFVPDSRRSRPRPRLAFGPAISVGHESQAEYFDMETTAPSSPKEIASGLARCLDEGFTVQEVRRIPAFFPSLDATINVVRYSLEGPFPADAAQSLERFLARVEIVIEKLKEGGARVERVDARPLILEMRLTEPRRLELGLRLGPKRTLKPEAIVREWLGLPHPSPGPAPAALEGFTIVRRELLSETSKGQLLTP